MKRVTILLLIFCFFYAESQVFTRKPLRALGNSGKIQVDMLLPGFGYSYIGHSFSPFYYGYFHYIYGDTLYAYSFRSLSGTMNFRQPIIFWHRTNYNNNAERIIANSIMPDKFGYSYIGSSVNYFDAAYLSKIYTNQLNINGTTSFSTVTIENGENVTTNKNSGILKRFIYPNKTNSSTAYLNSHVKYMDGAYPDFRNLHVEINRYGGYACRIDDIHGVELINVAEKFNKYGFRATNATNICAYVGGKWLMDDPEYRAAVNFWVGSGHELADHTPNGDTRKALIKHEDNWLTASSPGVDAVFTGKIVDTVYFEYAQHLIAQYVEADNTTHPADLIAPNYIVSQANGAYGSVNKETIERFGLVSYGGNLYWVLEHRDLSATDPDTLVLGDYYGRNNVNLTAATNIVYTYYDADSALVMTVDGLRTMMQIAKFYFNLYGLPLPKFLVQPGNNLHIRVDTMAVAARYEGYYGADLVNEGDNSYLGQHEYRKDRRYAFMFKRLQFNLAGTISDAVNSIAVNTGQNKVSTSITHLATSERSTIYSNLDSLLKFLYVNNIPVGTLSDWVYWMYYAPWDDDANICRPMENDFDNDNIPDGYILDGGSYDKTDGVITDSAAVTKAALGDMFYVYFGGPATGLNTFGIWTKGASGDSVNVIITLQSGTYSKKFAADTPDWTYYEWSNIVVTDADYSVKIDVNVSDYASGTVKVSGLSFRVK